MKSRYTTIMIEAASNRCKQVCSTCTYCLQTKPADRKALINDERQLYGKEAEDYFFYFISRPFEAAFTQSRN